MCLEFEFEHVHRTHTRQPRSRSFDGAALSTAATRGYLGDDTWMMIPGWCYPGDDTPCDDTR